MWPGNDASLWPTCNTDFSRGGGGEPENEATCTHCTDINSSLLQPEFCTVHFTCCSCSFPQKPAAWVGVGCGWNNRPPLGEKATAHAKNKKKTKQALSDASVEQAPGFFLQQMSCDLVCLSLFCHFLCF